MKEEIKTQMINYIVELLEDTEDTELIQLIWMMLAKS